MNQLHLNNHKSQSSYNSQQISIKLIIKFLNRNRKKNLSLAFQKLVKQQQQKSNLIKSRSIQYEFVNHCAIVIQTRFRGFIQKKRYRAFLPVYRRVSQLLLALYNGWKIRKILKLPPVKAQINQIKQKLKKNQASSARIAKRQLIDDLERISKKGRWIQLLHKFRTSKFRKVQATGKENNALYCNIKSVNIKNIFKKQPIKISKQNLVNMKQKQVLYQQVQKPKIQSFDQIPLKKNPNISIYHEISTDIDMIQSNYLKNDCSTKRQYLKKQKKLYTPKNLPKKVIENKIIEKVKIFKDEKQQKKQIKKQLQVEKPKLENQNLAQSKISKCSKTSKKIKVTVASPLAASVSSTSKIDESTIDLKVMQASTISLDLKGKPPFSQLIYAYENKYLGQKSKIKEKLNLMGSLYTHLLEKKNNLLMQF